MKSEEIERTQKTWAQMSDEAFASLKREDLRAELQPHFDHETMRRQSMEKSRQNDNVDTRRESGSNSLAGIQKNVMSRYWDAYIVARATIGIGGVVKGIAICLAVIERRIWTGSS